MHFPGFKASQGFISKHFQASAIPEHYAWTLAINVNYERGIKGLIERRVYPSDTIREAVLRALKKMKEPFTLKKLHRRVYSKESSEENLQMPPLKSMVILMPLQQKWLKIINNLATLKLSFISATSETSALIICKLINSDCQIMITILFTISVRYFSSGESLPIHYHFAIFHCLFAILGPVHAKKVLENLKLKNCSPNSTSSVVLWVITRRIKSILQISFLNCMVCTY